LIRGADVARGELRLDQSLEHAWFEGDAGSVERAAIRDGDILVARIAQRFRPVYVRTAPVRAVAHHSVIVVRGTNNNYLNDIFSNPEMRELVEAQIRQLCSTLRGAHRLSPVELSRVAIPVPPRGRPNELAKEVLVIQSPRRLGVLANRVLRDSPPKRANKAAFFDGPARFVAQRDEVQTAAPSPASCDCDALPSIASDEVDAMSSPPSLSASIEEVAAGVRRLGEQQGSAYQTLLEQFAALARVMETTYAEVLRVRQRVDDVLCICRATQDGIDAIRRQRRADGEKLFLIETKLDELTRDLKQSAPDDLRVYERLLERNFRSWGLLESLSREFLVLGDYLYSKLQGEQGVDFSPAILQFCRSLEHEIGRKTYLSFMMEVLSTRPQIQEDLKAELCHHKDGVKMLARQAQQVMQGGTEAFTLTLGQMREILLLAFGKRTVQTSLLLQLLREFVESDRHRAAHLSKGLIERLNLDRIVKELRNKCAHPHKLGVDSAEECRRIVPLAIERYFGFEPGEVRD